MNISKLLVASALVLAASALAAGDVWTPDDHGSIGSGQVKNLTTDGGWWYSYSDADNNGGAGTVSWNNDPGVWSDNIDAAGQIDVQMTNATGYAYPFTGIGFNWISDDNGGEGPYDISAKAGLCITYKLDKKMILELKWDGVAHGYSTYQASIPVAATMTVKDFAFTTFKRPYSDPDFPAVVTITEALALTSGVQFKYDGATGTTASLQLMQVGFAGTCTGGGVDAVRSSAMVAGLKANLSGSSLAFSGLGKKSAKVEIISLQGQVVASKTITASQNTLDLSKAAHGVYVVKASGKDLSFSKMITLK